MKIYFIRHADPWYPTDTLTEKGWREAGLLAPRVAKIFESENVRTVYCSPLGRARDTARTCLSPLGFDLDKEAVTYDWLREFPALMKMPDGQYRMPWDLLPSWWTAHEDLYDKDGWFRGPTMSLGGDVEEKYLEVARGIDGIAASCGYTRDGHFYRTEKGTRDTLLVFCHLGVMFVMLSRLLSMPTPVLWQNFFVAPSSVTLVSTEEVVPGEVAFRVKYLGDVSHLLAANEPPSDSGFFCECR